MESCVLPQKAYQSMFLGTFCNNVLPKPNAPQVSKTYHPGVLHGWHPISTWHTYPINIHYRMGKLMPIRFLLVDTKNGVTISYMASTQLGLLEVLCYNRNTQQRCLNAIKKHTFQPVHTPNTVTVHLFQDHNSTLPPSQDHMTTHPPLQDHNTLHNIEDLINMFPSSFDKIGSMPTVEIYIMGEFTYIFPQANGTLTVYVEPYDFNKAIICEHHKASILEEITHKLSGSTHIPN